MSNFTSKPWDGSASRWPDAASFAESCLLNLNEGDDKSKWIKDKCKLPIKEPSGEINTNAVHAAAAALAGARGALKGVSPSAKRQAARSLVKLYHELNEDVPHSIKSIAH